MYPEVVPDILMAPFTSSGAPGDVVPTPTFPALNLIVDPLVVHWLGAPFPLPDEPVNLNVPEVAPLPTLEMTYAV